MLAIKSRFGSLAYEDPMAELKKLKQTGSLKEYLRAFELLLDKAQLSEGQAISCFWQKKKGRKINAFGVRSLHLGIDARTGNYT